MLNKYFCQGTSEEQDDLDEDDPKEDTGADTEDIDDSKNIFPPMEGLAQLKEQPVRGSCASSRTRTSPHALSLLRAVRGLRSVPPGKVLTTTSALNKYFCHANIASTQNV